MRIFPRLLSLWNTLFRRERLESELDEELRSTLETLTDRYMADGMAADAARRAALRALGGPAGFAHVRAEVREGRIGAGLDALILDLRHARRRLSTAPGLTSVIVVTLAVGIGANTAIFSVVDAMLLQPLPYRDADRLVFIWLDRSDVGYPRSPLSWPDLRDLREGSRTVAEFGGIWATGTVALTGNGDPEQLRSALVTPNFFQVLGAESALGRTFRAEDSAAGAPPSVLLGWDLFERRYGADPSIVGRQILVNDESATVIGVMPKSFRLLLPPDSSVPDGLQVWLPIFADVEQWPRGSLFLRVIGRMRPGVTIVDAREDLAAVAHRISGELGHRRVFTTVALQADDVREIRGPLMALFAGVGILLMIACVNVANLLIARAASRARETAVRIALGASRARLVRQSLIEGLLLMLLGAAAGLLAGWAGLRVLLAFTPDSLSRLSAARIDATVLVFTLAVSLGWGLLFSLAPIAEIWKTDVSGSLAGAGGRLLAVPVRYRTRRTLVVLQMALSVVLLVGAALLVRTFVKVHGVDPGFRSDRHLTFRVALPGRRYETADAQVAAMTELRRRIGSLPGVTGVGAISHLPYDDLPNWGLTYAPVGARTTGGAPFANARAILPGLFETLGVQLIDGRFFTDHDKAPDRPGVIVDDMLAERLWPGRSAVGQPFLLGQGEPTRRAFVVGVVRHLKLRSLVDDLIPQIYLPYRLWQRSPMAFVVETGMNPSALVPDVRTAVAAFDPQLPVFDVRAFDAYIESARSIRRFTMWLAAAFALSALILTCIGVYGVLAYAVTSRRHEFGIRRALGADTTQVVRQVLDEGLRFAAVGTVGGLAGAAAAARLLQSQLYAVHPRDPVSYGTAVALLLCGAVLACWIPAHRAANISPMDALRAE